MEDRRTHGGKGSQKTLRPVTARKFRITLTSEKGGLGFFGFRLFRED